MAAAAPILPISVPTGLGDREVLDCGYPVLNLQKLENPQASIYRCAQRYGAQTVRSIFEKLEERSKVSTFEELNLSDNLIGDEGAQYLAEGLKDNKALKVLLLPRTGITAAGMSHIGALLGNSTSVQNVILSGNHIDAEGVKGDFGAGLAKNKSVKSLCLAACRLLDEGVISLCDSIKSHPKLEHLSLTYNRLEVGAAKALAKMLATNQALRFLDVCGNSFGEEGAVELAKGLKDNKGRLTTFAIGTCAIKTKGAQAMVDFFLSKDGAKMTYMDLRHNNVPYADIAKMREKMGKPMSGPEGWMVMFGERQLLLNR
jgi:Ran GTPase-activating protein (RanGAP) involved in mRNA processing and transport